MLAVPGLSAGSCAAPPPKAYSIAISGTVASCTNQASMPPGDTSRWILAAACEGAAVRPVKATVVTSASAARRVRRIMFTSASPRASARCP